jgi:hypothetical protein
MILADLSPVLVVRCPRPRSCVGASRRGRFAVRDTVPFIPFTLLVAESGGNWADGGRLADSDGDEVVDEVPFTPFIDVWIFSGRFDLLIV